MVTRTLSQSTSRVAPWLLSGGTRGGDYGPRSCSGRKVAFLSTPLREETPDDVIAPRLLALVAARGARRKVGLEPARPSPPRPPTQTAKWEGAAEFLARMGRGIQPGVLAARRCPELDCESPPAAPKVTRSQAERSTSAAGAPLGTACAIADAVQRALCHSRATHSPSSLPVAPQAGRPPRGGADGQCLRALSSAQWSDQNPAVRRVSSGS